MLCKKSGMPEQKYMPHSSKNCCGKISDQQSVKDGLGGDLGNRTDVIKNCKKYEHKWKRELKSLKTQNKIIFNMFNKSGWRREIKKIKGKASKKLIYSNSSISSSDSYSDYSLYSDSN